MKYWLVISKPAAYTLFSITMLALVLFPAVTHAGIFSFIAGVLGVEKEVFVSNNQNLQNVALLQAAVSPTGSQASGGGEITIIGGVALASDTASFSDSEKDKRPPSDQISLYVVRKGDSLSQIAQMFGVTVNTIRWNNDLKGNVISEGQTLVILPVSGVRHTIKKGDTLASIAKLYAGDVSEIKSYNNITDSTVLNPGEIIIVPDGEVHQDSVPAAVRSVANNYPTYDGYYIRPISGGRKSQGIHGYNGVDLADSVGTPILASATGDVIISRGSGWNGGYGNYVVISHPNGTQTLYAHNLRNIVFEGDHVVQGQVIAYMGSTGKSTGSHVHFEIRGAKNPF